MIVADYLQAFKLQIATLQPPLVVLLEQQRPDQAHDGRFVGKDPYDAGVALGLGVQSFQRMGSGSEADAPWGTERGIGLPFLFGRALGIL